MGYQFILYSPLKYLIRDLVCSNFRKYLQPSTQSVLHLSWISSSLIQSQDPTYAASHQ